MGQALNIPRRSLEESPWFDPIIDHGKLEILYRQMEDVLLQPSRLEFATIGFIGEASKCLWRSPDDRYT